MKLFLALVMIGMFGCTGSSIDSNFTTDDSLQNSMVTITNDVPDYVESNALDQNEPSGCAGDQYIPILDPITHQVSYEQVPNLCAGFYLDTGDPPPDSIVKSDLYVEKIYRAQ